MLLLLTSVCVQVVEAYKAVDVKERPSSGPGGWWKALFQPLGLYRVSFFNLSTWYYIYKENKKCFFTYVRSRISSKFTSASRVWFSDRACYGVGCVCPRVGYRPATPLDGFTTGTSFGGQIYLKFVYGTILGL